MVSVYSEKDKKRRSAPQRAQGGQGHAGQKGKGVESHYAPTPKLAPYGLYPLGISSVGRNTEKRRNTP